MKPMYIYEGIFYLESRLFFNYSEVTKAKEVQIKGSKCYWIWNLIGNVLCYHVKS